MSSSSRGASGSRGRQSPAENRRWLKRRVPRGQLYKLSPGRPRPKRLGSVQLADRVRTVARAWWSWLTVAVVLQERGHWRGALVAAGIAFVFYHTSADTHPAVFPL